MNRKLFLLTAATVLGVVAFAVQPPNPPKPPPPNKDDLHLDIHKDMANEGLLVKAKGRVELGLHRKGDTDNQRLDIAAEKLHTNTTYLLWAALGDDTNFTYTGSFTTARNGHGEVRFTKVGDIKSKGGGKVAGKGKTPLPAVLDPISNIRALAIANVNTQAVLTADLRDPEKLHLHYLVKRKLSNGDAEATLHLDANTRKVHFDLHARGLTPATNYFLALNGNVVESAVSKKHGDLSFKNLPVAGTNILDLRTVAIWDSVSNSVLSTTLP